MVSFNIYFHIQVKIIDDLFIISSFNLFSDIGGIEEQSPADCKLLIISSNIIIIIIVVVECDC